MAFKNLSNAPVKQAEDSITAYWDQIHLLERSVKEREGCPSYVFFEGPPTANGKPGIHHVLSRALKDCVCRYKTMQGYQVKRKAGWDTHGLPVEIEVEKRLALSSKTDIEAYGVEAFNHKCRESVFEYESLWRQMTKDMAYLVDLDHPYITLENDYIESVWYILSEFFKQGYIYEGHKVLPYCPRCGTGLASHEVAQGYKEVKTNTITAKFKRKDRDNEYFLAWTTTPWTLSSNVALALSPSETYLRVRQKEEIYYVSKTLATKVLGEDYEVLEELPAKALEYVEYEQLLPWLTPDKKAFYIVLMEYVTTEDGTGIVHTAPAFGEDDYQAARKYDLPVLQPVGEDGRYVATPLQGRFVMEEGLDVDIIKELAKENKIYKKEKMEHNYPHCWRCSTPLMYYAKPSYYIEVTKLREQLIANNQTVNWFPDYVGEKRFGNWLENINDWAISRSRYWGTPLNIWVCQDPACGCKDTIGSQAQLKERSLTPLTQDVELHRPYVDAIEIACPKCQKPMQRVKDVIDVWFDSGSMPFAQHHYPFEHKEDFDTLFPADFICEGIDQTRGWFYSLLVISTFMKGRAPYKNVLVNDLVLDKEGKKMSKSKGNTVDPFSMFEEYGADVLRFYLHYVSPAWVPTRFDEDGLREVHSKFFSTWRNVYNFFTLYANTDGIDPKTFCIPVTNRPELDRWIVSRFHSLTREVKDALERFDMTKAVRAILEFVNEDLSNWYIRRSRRRFWESSLSEDKKAVYLTTYEILRDLARLCAPLVPFISEEMYRNLTGEDTVHTAFYPKADPQQIDPVLEDKMQLLRRIVTLGRATREGARIKVRQPLAKAFVDSAHQSKIKDLSALIEEELNIKELVFSEDLSAYMDYSLKPNFKTLGKKLGPLLKEFQKALGTLDTVQAVKRLEANQPLELVLGEEAVTLEKEDFLIQVTPKPGYDVATEGDLFIVLDTALSPDLQREGNAREFVSRISQIRKAQGLEVMDHIRIQWQADPAMAEAISLHEDYIATETLAQQICQQTPDESFDRYQLNGHETFIQVTRL